MSAFRGFLELLRFNVNIYHNAKVCGAWGIEENRPGVASFHTVTIGTCLLKIPDKMPIQLNLGDLVIFTRGLKHQLYPSKKMTGEQQHLHYAAKEEGTGLLCGEVVISQTESLPILNLLPDFILIRNDEKNPWLDQIVTLINHESYGLDKPYNVTINRLSELLFIFALRHYLENNNIDKGILGLYTHSKMSLALDAFHHNVACKWDISSLARQAGMSRTVFSEMFKKVSGWTVNQYLVWWRMQIAYEKLKGGQKVLDVAFQVGYHSESSFSRAFFKHFQINAGNVRRGRGNHCDD